MTEWWQLLLGGSGVGVPVTGLVLAGKLLPSWVVNRERATLIAQHEAGIAALEASHQRELKSKDDAHASEVEGLKSQHIDALAVRDRENAYLAREHQHERERGDVERGRSDALADRVGQLAHEFGAQSVHLIRALPEAASGERPAAG